ncbi:MAG: DUF4915 domain-containing protein [Methylococcales bacterium]
MFEAELTDCSLEIKDSLLVSCPNTGGLIYVHGKSHLTISYSDVTGISEYGDGFLWVLQSNGARSLQRVVDDKIDTIELDQKHIDLHDILVDGNDIYAVHTETNHVVKYDHDFDEVERWGLDGELDSSHINCIAMYKGRLIASIFGRFQQYREYKSGTKELGQIIDVQTSKTLITGLSQPHSLLASGNTLYLCNSETNELFIYCDEILKTSVRLPGYARGLAVSEDYIYVGLSKSRNADVHEGLAEAGIAILKRDNFILEGVKTIPFSEIYDIKLLKNKSSFILKTLAISSNNDNALSTLQKKQLAGRSEYDELLKDFEKMQDAYLRTKSALERTQDAYKQTQDAYKQTQDAYKQTQDAYKQTQDAYKQTQDAYDKKCEEVDVYKRREK